MTGRQLHFSNFILFPIFCFSLHIHSEYLSFIFLFVWVRHCFDKINSSVQCNNVKITFNIPPVSLKPYKVLPVCFDVLVQNLRQLIWKEKKKYVGSIHYILPNYKFNEKCNGLISESINQINYSLFKIPNNLLNEHGICSECKQESCMINCKSFDRSRISGFIKSLTTKPFLSCPSTSKHVS